MDVAQPVTVCRQPVADRERAASACEPDLARRFCSLGAALRACPRGFSPGADVCAALVPAVACVLVSAAQLDGDRWPAPGHRNCDKTERRAAVADSGRPRG